METINLAKEGLAAENNSKQKLYKRFIWDEILGATTLVSALLVVVLTLGEALSDNRGLACNVPTTMNRDQARYVTLWCTRKVQTVDSMSLIILAQSLFVYSPHLLWEAVAAPTLEQFFVLTSLLSRLREESSGQYSNETVQIVRKLQKCYEKEKTLFQSIHKTYLVKLGSQLLFSLAFFIGMVIVFYVNSWQFSPDFICHGVGNDSARAHYVGNQDKNQSLVAGFAPIDIPCTHTIALLAYPVWICNVLILIVTVIASIVGLVYVIQKPWDELEFKNHAEFRYFFSLNVGSEEIYAKNKKRKNTKKVKITTDLDFLVVLLYNKDEGLGETFFDVQIDIETDRLWASDYERYSSIISQLVDSPNREKSIRDNLEKSNSHLGRLIATKCKSLRDKREGQQQNHYTKDTDLGFPFDTALHLYCGSKGCSMSLLYVCQKVVAFDFNFFFHSQKMRSRKEKRSKDSVEVSVEKYTDHFKYIKAPVNILSKAGDGSVQLYEQMRVEEEPTDETKPPKYYSYNLILVTCLEPHFQAGTALLLLENVFRNCTADKCLIMILYWEESNVVEAFTSIFV
ncbi:uncharacterized protein [Oscarella lobularis]